MHLRIINLHSYCADIGVVDDSSVVGVVNLSRGLLVLHLAAHVRALTVDTLFFLGKRSIYSLQV